MIHPDKHLCKRCIVGYANGAGTVYDKWRLHGMEFKLLQKCDGCNANTYCHFVKGAHYPSTGGYGNAESDEVTKVTALDLAAKPKPIATNKRDAKKRHMKHNNKPKGNTNIFTRRKT